MSWQHLLLLFMIDMNVIVIALGFYFLAKEKVWHTVITVIVAMVLFFGTGHYFKHLMATGVI